MPEPIEIFRAGRHTTMAGETLAFSEADLAGAASAYDPKLHEAPLVVGHPAHDAPAYGWVKALQCNGGRLSVEPDQVDPAFAELVRAGRFKKVSASFYRPDASGNPKPGSWYLRHVGFLGAAAPAVKGLRPIELAGGDEGAVTVEFVDAAEQSTARLFRGLRDLLIEKFGLDEANKALSTWDIETIEAEALLEPEDEAPAYAEPTPKAPAAPVATPPAAPAPDAAFAEREAQLAAREAAVAKAENERRHAERVAFCDGLVAQGRPLPCPRDLVVAFMAHLDAVADTVSFGEGEKRTAGQLFRDELLARLPRQVDFNERAPAECESPRDSVSLAEQITEYQDQQRSKGRHVSATQALEAITNKGAT